MIKKRKVNRNRRAQPTTIPAPLGGLNGRDALAEMAHTDAFLLENFFPALTSLDTRGGSLDFVTGIGAPVESLEVFTGGSVSKMLGMAGGDIYDVSAAGAVGAPLLSARISDQTTSCMFSNSADTPFLLIYSGADAPLSYDGATLTALAITGLTGSQDTLLQGFGFKGRVFLRQIGMLGFYYLGVGAIQGAASYFDLQQQALKGGELAAICSFSQNIAGQTPADYCVFATTEGEYIMYAGTDPSNAGAWGLVGRFYGPRPIGKKCWFNFRSDVYFLTEEGIISFTEIMSNAESTSVLDYLTSKLGNSYQDLVLYEGTPGWSGIIYPKGSALIINVPLSGSVTGQYCQFVMNTNSRSNAWTKYVGWNALCWGLCNQLPYFGTSDGRVVLADTGFTDNGMQIVAQCRQAWNSFDNGKGIGNSDKQFHFITLALQADGMPYISCALNTNFIDSAPTTGTPVSSSAGGEWDTATWDVDSWGGSYATQSITISVGELGYVASPWLVAISTASKVRFLASRITLESTSEVLL